MTTEQQQTDGHVWGTPEVLQGDSYRVDEEVSVKCTAYLGRKDYTDSKGKPRRTGFFRVQNGQVAQEWRCGIKNEVILFKTFGILKPEALVGHMLTFQARYFPGIKANGLVVVGVK